MHVPTLRKLVASFLVVGPFVAFALPASAQQPAPPDVVFEPLVTAAEGERLHHADVAHAHAEAALRFAPDGSALATRARAIFTATPAPRAPVPEDTVYEPLVTAAENDAATGHRDLALDRLSATLRVLSPTSALATRARNLYAIVSGSGAPANGGTTTTTTATGTATTATGTATTATGTATTATTTGTAGATGTTTDAGTNGATGTTGTTSTDAQLLGSPTQGGGTTTGAGTATAVVPPPPSYQVGAAAPQLEQPPQELRRPGVRGGAEMVPLYIAAAGDGLVTGVWLLVAGGVDPNVAQGWYATLPMLLAGGFAIGAWGLDYASNGMHTGQPNAIAGGALTGALIAPLLVGYLNQCPTVTIHEMYPSTYTYTTCDTTSGWRSPDSATSWTTAWISGAIGLAGGLAYAYGVKPRPGAAFFAEASALWGLYFGGMVGLASQDSRVTWASLAVGTGAGYVLGAVLGQALRPTAGRVGLLFAGFAGGVLIASTPLAIVAGLGGQYDAGWTAVALSLGGIGGLTLVGILTGGMVDQGDADQLPPMMVGAAPIPGGGGLVTVSGAF